MKFAKYSRPPHHQRSLAYIMQYITSYFTIKSFAIFILIFTIVSQVNSQPILGIDEIKIGMTENEFTKLPEIRSKIIKNAQDSTYALDEKIVWKTTIDTRLLSRNPNIFQIYTKSIITYEFSMPIGIKNINGIDSYSAKAFFYNGELVELGLYLDFPYNDSDNFIKILASKYGNPLIEDMTGIATCQNSYGAKSQHLEGTKLWIWGAKSKITAIVIITNRDCGRKKGARYSIYDSNRYTEALGKNKKYKEEEENKSIKDLTSSSKL